MEALLHYCWKHRLLPLSAQLLTTDGRTVEVIDPGLHNSDSGPDFFNAKVRIDGEMWAGNVEIHLTSKDWYAHHHDKDAAYDNVILHVVGNANSEEILTSSGRRLPQLVITVPEKVRGNYQQLLSEDAYPPCYKVIPTLSPLLSHSWMAALQTERLQQKTEAIQQRLEYCEGDWERAYFITLSRSFGFGTNGDAFEQWARALPLKAAAHHRDDIMQIEALFFGQAGLLNVAAVPERMKLETACDDYFQRLESEYAFLRHKFQLTPIDPRCWKFMRMRPQNFPHIRLAQLAKLYHDWRTNISKLLDCTSVDDLKALLRLGVTPYWETHYTFGHESAVNTKQLSTASLNSIMINTAIPILFAYGRYIGKEALCQRAFDLLEALKPEANSITRLWKSVGLDVHSAGDSQALIQLKKQYCDRKDCLRCRFGYEYLKK